MIIESMRASRRDGYVYLNNPKAGCSTLKFMLWRKAFDAGDIDHLPNSRELHSREFWDSEFNMDWIEHGAFVFSFVRNPYARILSCYLDKIARKNIVLTRYCSKYDVDEAEAISFEDFLETVSASEEPFDDPHWRPQAGNLLGGALAPDFIGHFEFFGQDYASLAERLGLATEMESRQTHATSAADKLAAWMTPRAVDLIRAKYAKDFEAFGYDQDPTILDPDRSRMAIPPVEPGVRDFMAAVCELSQDADAPLGALRKAVKALPDNPYAAELCCGLLVERGRLKAAEKLLAESLRKWPDHYTVQRCRRRLKQARKLDEA